MTVVRKHGPQPRQDPRLPINQSAVAVKADGSELFEVHSHIIKTQFDWIHFDRRDTQREQSQVETQLAASCPHLGDAEVQVAVLAKARLRRCILQRWVL